MTFTGRQENSGLTAEAAQARAEQTAELYALSRDLAVAASLDTIVNTVTRHVKHAVGRDGVVLLATDGHLGNGSLPQHERAAAQPASRTMRVQRTTCPKKAPVSRVPDNRFAEMEAGGVFASENGFCVCDLRMLASLLMRFCHRFIG